MVSQENPSGHIPLRPFPSYDWAFMVGMCIGTYGKKNEKWKRASHLNDRLGKKEYTRNLFKLWAIFLIRDTNSNKTDKPVVRLSQEEA